LVHIWLDLSLTLLLEVLQAFYTTKDCVTRSVHYTY
jgi:hypothetical protein